MEYISICEWNKFQHYKHRNPPWVKLYTKILDDDEFHFLSDGSKLLFMSLLVFASRRKNKVRYDLDWLQRKLPINAPISREMIDQLVKARFVEVTSE